MEFVYSLERRGRPVKFKKWNIGSPKAEDVALLRSAGYPYLLSTVLAARASPRRRGPQNFWTGSES